MRKTRILVTGAAGYLGSELCRLINEAPNFELYACLHHRHPPHGQPVPLDLTDRRSVQETLKAVQPDMIIHTAYDKNPDRMQAVIVAGTEQLVEAGQSCRFIHISTDFVFDGTAGPYRETDPPCPNTPYGRYKYQAEQLVEQTCPNHLIVRTSLITGTTPLPPRWQAELEKLRAGHKVVFYTNEIRNPIHVNDLARGILAAAPSDLTGVLHIAGPQYISRYEELKLFARWQQIDPELIGGNLSDGQGRPLNCSLVIERFTTLFPEIHLRTPEKCWF